MVRLLVQRQVMRRLSRLMSLPILTILTLLDVGLTPESCLVYR